MENLKTTLENIAGNTGRFVSLLMLIIAAFVIAYVFEKRAQKLDAKEGRPSEEMFSTRKLAIIGVFAAISFVLMLFEFPLPFAPSFYKLDFSDIPALIGGFAAGPMVGVMIEFIKVVLNVIIQGPTPGFVGEIANFVIGAGLVIPATVIYRFKKTRKSALISCVAGTLCITVIGAALNAFFLLPAYAIAFGQGIDSFIAAGTAINPAVTNLFTFCALCVAPFNLLKGVLDSVVTFLVYKQLSPILKSSHNISAKTVKPDQA